MALGEEFRGKGVRSVPVPVDRLNALDVLISISHQGVSWARNGCRMLPFGQ